MGPKARMAFAVLALRTQPNAVSKYRLEPIEIRTPDVDALIRHQACQLLPPPLPHDPRLAVMYAKPLVKQNGTHHRGEPPDAPLKLLPPGEREIARIPRVFRPNPSRQHRQ